MVPAPSDDGSQKPARPYVGKDTHSLYEAHAILTSCRVQAVVNQYVLVQLARNNIEQVFFSEINRGDEY